MKSWMALLALVPACGFHSTAPSDARVEIDAPPDARLCFGTVLPICFPSAEKLPLAARVFDQDTTNLDTDESVGTFCNQDNDQKAKYCVVAGISLTLPVGKKLLAHGSKPLVLLSTSTMDILGSIDVSSHAMGAQLIGSGANPVDASACSFVTPGVAPMLGGGAAGASFGTKGGNGSVSTPPIGVVGLSGSALVGFPTILRGGCKGQDSAVTMDQDGKGGNGGGAVGLVAVQIHVEGTINASGGGGRGGVLTAMGFTIGGAGGGSGGMIVLDAFMPINFGTNAKLWANGGGGGQGGNHDAIGAPGAESADPAQPALGSNGNGPSANGGNGSLSDAAGVDGRASSDNGGGGGGGGGGGVIHAPGLTDTNRISPSSKSP